MLCSRAENRGRCRGAYQSSPVRSRPLVAQLVGTRHSRQVANPYPTKSCSHSCIVDSRQREGLFVWRSASLTPCALNQTSTTKSLHLANSFSGFVE